MSQPTTTLSLIQSWPHQQLPNDILYLEQQQKWIVLGATDHYWEFSQQQEEAVPQPTTTELYRAEKKAEAFCLLTYNPSTRKNEAWIASALEGERTSLNLQDAAEIAYSEKTQQLYWITQGRVGKVYDFETNTSKTIWEDHSFANAYVSDNGLFLAWRDTDSNFFVANLERQEIIFSKKQEAGQYYQLVGVSDEGDLLLLTQKVVEKNSRTNPTNAIMRFNSTGSTTLLEGKIGWARLTGNTLAVWDREQLSVYQMD